MNAEQLIQARASIDDPLRLMFGLAMPVWYYRLSSSERDEVMLELTGLNDREAHKLLGTFHPS